ncbi:hypothetical protein, partial [Flavobacterium cyanobacteriorum]|uniref:hypothetical protein n=1 Tax=Flavobacterium cyanobacteriorum TaxID=2022802 RepID=UPI0013FD96BE
SNDRQLEIYSNELFGIMAKADLNLEATAIIPFYVGVTLTIHTVDAHRMATAGAADAEDVAVIKALLAIFQN